MIKKLRKKFIFITVSSITIVLLLIMAVINFANYQRMEQKSDQILELLVRNEGRFPPPEAMPLKGRPQQLPPETAYETRYFSALFGQNSELILINTGSVAAITDEEAVDYAVRAGEREQTKGKDGAYKYLATDTAAGTLYIFLDYSRDLASFQSFLTNSLIVSAVGLSAIFALVVLFSRIALKPAEESYEKQKRFITDASHELKTPLTIIEANTEVLEISSGENEWTQSIKKQVRRLSDLTAQLITLSRFDEENTQLCKEEFSLSEAVAESLDSFYPVAEKERKTISADLPDDIIYIGDETAIRQLITILIENAVKYATIGSDIKISLSGKGRRAELRFENQTEHLDSNKLKHLFDRFYRADLARSSADGGYGIGLSVAKAIVTAHKGKIRAESPNGNSLLIITEL
ncbi:MAG TPA: HAMP domain-containing histidine kinase [Clostridiaceae bacterium]|nr:HAMP domain-containing histidine kinase [Clostridiaceae bacterium]